MTMDNNGTMIMQVLIIAMLTFGMGIAIMYAIQSALSRHRDEDSQTIRRAWGDGTLPKLENDEDHDANRDLPEDGKEEP
ncbi:hypothetical protein [Bifidobacterium sp. ESL0745]|uniref:hypothetical protein n=1 Tax=Bifidobacterium sp. ESL0745 TaxID=2983226 RepID=UPI0023F61E3A|nr:hypothetical protein [Bifidobacterium sp. ESL0745]MDF7665714.1 hypothetical protein [Bifidobacterium sp. ESL0745]